MASEARARKLADRIKVIVAQTLETRIKDPGVHCRRVGLE